MSLLDTTQIVIPTAVLHQQMADETVLFHLTNEYYYGLDEIGSRIWQLLKERHTPNFIIDTLMAEYEVDETTLRSDIERLLGELTHVGLIQLEPGPSL